jgi:hypothetical protein
LLPSTCQQSQIDRSTRSLRLQREISAEATSARAVTTLAISTLPEDQFMRRIRWVR